MDSEPGNGLLTPPDWRPGKAGSFERLERRLAESNWTAPVLLALLTLYFYFEILFTNRHSFPWDARDFFYPYWAFVHEQLRHFRLPLWDPYVFSGFPIIGDPEAQIFYPPNWLMVLLHPFSPLTFKAAEIQEIIHYFLAGLFMYFLALEFTEERISALFGGALFMFSGMMVAHAEHTAIVDAMAWYPLVFLLARRGLLRNSLYWTIAAGVSLGLADLTGHWQHTVALGLVLFVYFAYEACAGPRRRKMWPRWIWQLALIAAISAGLAMVQILPSYELSALSVRSYVTRWDSIVGNSPRYFWTLILPNFFGGLKGAPWREHVEPSMNYIFLSVPGCVFALLGLIEMARRRNFFWLGLILIASDVSIGVNGLLGRFLADLPVLKLFRNPALYFNLANFGLCLMAAVGLRGLRDEKTQRFYRRWLPAALTSMLGVAVIAGFAIPSAWAIPGWFHMLSVLALFSIMVTALLKGLWGSRWFPYAVLTLTLFELCFYGKAQIFNSNEIDPRRVMSYRYADGRKEVLDFLRADPAGGFRVASLAGSVWLNGPNVWRIPSIYGWNPIMLRRYQDYLRQFTETGWYAEPADGLDHNVDSAMLKLLGAKYLVLYNSDMEHLRLAGPEKLENFTLELSDQGWMNVMRNSDYLSRAWFYPQADTVSDPAAALALLNSKWFDPRRSLIFAQQDLAGRQLPVTKALSTIALGPDQVADASSGHAVHDDVCAEPRMKYGNWAGKGNWIRFNVPGPAQPGRYVLLAEYAAGGLRPSLIATVQRSDGQDESSGPTSLLETSGWGCRFTRSADLGDFILSPGVNRLTLTYAQNPNADLYSLWLVRLPESLPPAADSFSFRNFSYSENRLAFQAKLPQAGYVLVNEVNYPGWEATVDGRPAPILQADGIFRAVWVLAGTHQIEMRFHSRFLLLGAAISLLTLAAAGFALVKLHATRELRGAADDDEES